jgi:hypothetical protein
MTELRRDILAHMPDMEDYPPDTTEMAEPPLATPDKEKYPSETLDMEGVLLVPLRGRLHS